MVQTLISAAVVVLASVAVGQLACAVAGMQRWVAAAPAVGLSLLMLIAVPALHFPGRMATGAALIAAVTVAGVVLMWRRPEHRPPLDACLAGSIPFTLALIPFVVQGYSGILGVGFNNDMAAHLLYAGAYRDVAAAHATPLLTYYPFGPHALAAALSKGTGAGLEAAFTGLTLAVPVLTAFAVHGLIGTTVGRTARVLAAGLSALPYIAAGYYGQGAFKELMLSALVLGFAAWLMALREDGWAGIARLVPGGLILGGILSVYSLPGLAWPIGVAGLFGLWLIIGAWSDGGLRAVAGAVRSLVPAVVLAGAVTVVALVPQVPRLLDFWDYMHRAGTGTGINKEDVGNLFGPVDMLETAGTWFNSDFRFPADGMTGSVLLSLVVLGLAFWGASRTLRSGRGELVIVAGVCAFLWAYADRTQSPYVAAKALVPLSTCVVALAVVAVSPRSLSENRAAALVVALLTGTLVWSSAGILRAMPVGPMSQQNAVAAFAADVRGDVVAYPANDEFANGRLLGAAVVQPVFSSGSRWAPASFILPAKQLDPAVTEGHDIDTMGPAVLGAAQWAVMPRDASDSEMPLAFRPVRRSGRWS